MRWDYRYRIDLSDVFVDSVQALFSVHLVGY